MSEKKLEPDIVERLMFLNKPALLPSLQRGLTDALAEITRLRAERPGWAEAIEAGRIAIRDKWGDGCTRLCVREKNASPAWVCSCENIAKLVVSALHPPLPDPDAHKEEK